MLSRNYGPLRGHGLDMGMIFANRPHARGPAWVISYRKILFSESRVIPDMGVTPCKGKPCLISILNFQVINLVPYWNLTHSFFNPRLSSLVPLNIVLVECKKHCFRLQNTRDLFFLEKKAPGRAAPHRSPDWGCMNTLFWPQSIQISKHPDIQISRFPYIHILAHIRRFADPSWRRILSKLLRSN